MQWDVKLLNFQNFSLYELASFLLLSWKSKIARRGNLIWLESNKSFLFFFVLFFLFLFLFFLKIWEKYRSKWFVKNAESVINAKIWENVKKNRNVSIYEIWSN